MTETNALNLHSYIVLKILNALEQEPINSKILLQKIAFLILRKYKQLFNYADFKPHKFGPYSASLEQTLEELENLDEVKVSKKEGIKITPKGEKFLKELEAFIDSQNLPKIEDFEGFIVNIKRDFKDFSRNEILAFIYKSFPDYISSSIEADKIDYEKEFLKLYEKGKLGISKIAELLNWSYDKVYDYIKNHGKLVIQ